MSKSKTQVPVYFHIIINHSTAFSVTGILQGCKNSEKWVACLGLPLVRPRIKTSEPCGCLILEDLQTLHIPTNKKLEVWTQATSFIPWWLLLLFQENVEAKRDLKKKEKKNEIRSDS